MRGFLSSIILVLVFCVQECTLATPHDVGGGTVGYCAGGRHDQVCGKPMGQAGADFSLGVFRGRTSQIHGRLLRLARFASCVRGCSLVVRKGTALMGCMRLRGAGAKEAKEWEGQGTGRSARRFEVRSGVGGDERTAGVHGSEGCMRLRGAGVGEEGKEGEENGQREESVCASGEKTAGAEAEGMVHDARDLDYWFSREGDDADRRGERKRGREGQEWDGVCGGFRAREEDTYEDGPQDEKERERDDMEDRIGQSEGAMRNRGVHGVSWTEGDVLSQTHVHIHACKRAHSKSRFCPSCLSCTVLPSSLSLSISYAKSRHESSVPLQLLARPALPHGLSTVSHSRAGRRKESCSKLPFFHCFNFEDD